MVYDKAPPRTRGSTRPRAAWSARFEGSPAHAGIDPRPSTTTWPWSRLPRARGDRPAASPTTTRMTAAPPRTRDRPMPSIAPALPCGAPPRTRGSTPGEDRERRADGGSPAHAGIDRPGKRAPIRRKRLPRARGDRPVRQAQEVPPGPAPPRTRGSTRAPLLLRALRPGSPAHAGIDPLSRHGHLPASRLPRARGDRPYSAAEHIAERAAPPRTRGSTLQEGASHVRASGSPAHAGIDPSG